MNHPIVFPAAYPDGDYFAATRYSEEYTFDGQTAVLTYWHRPLHATTCRAVALPPGLDGRTAFLCFIFFVLEAI